MHGIRKIYIIIKKRRIVIFLEVLKKTKIYELLVKKENELDDHEISENIKIILSESIPILAQTRNYLPEYTLHDYTHSISILNIAANIIPEQTLNSLNNIELSLIIFSAFLHDIGMACSEEERNKIINTDDFKRFFNSYEEDEINFIFSEYIRKNHAKRSYDFIIKNYKNRIKYKNIEYSELAANICLGHCLDISDLKNENLFPKEELIESFECNIHYIAMILRLADYLDIFPNRAPIALYNFVSPQNKISILEWQKHMSISGWKFTSNEIRIAANCKNIDYERAIRETLKGINAEIKNVYNALKDYNSDLSSKYKFFINEDISFDDIKNDGSYIFDNLEFKIDYKSILNLLMGEKLYNSPEIALRELLQNSIDAINFRKRLQKESFEPKIEINFDGQTLSISDNGIGMDEYIFKKYFLNVGKSFYKSKDASSLVTDYDSISEFGIGVLSSFMVADSIEIESKKFSEDTNNPHTPICIEVPTAYGYMIKKKSFKQQVGTKITLKLKENHPFKSITELISKISPFVNYNITVIENDKEIILKPKVINKSLADEIMKPYKCDVCLEIDFSKSDNEVLKDIEGKVFFISPKSNNYNMDDWSYKLKRFTYQNGFLIENPRDKYSNELDIFPHCGDAVIVANFKGKSRLNVSVDRSRFIEDDKYRMIEKLIEQEIAKKLYEYLLPYHEKFSVEKYYKFQYEFLSKFNIDLDFFLDKQKLSTIIYVGLFTNDGSITYMPASKLLEYELIIYPGDFYGKEKPYDSILNRIKLIDELKCIFGKNFNIPVLGVSISNVNVDSLFFGERQPFIEALFLTETNYRSTVELLNIAIKKDEESDFIEKLGELRFVKNIFSPNKNNIPLFAQNEFENIYFNLGHNFFKSFLNKKYYSFEEKNKLIASLSPLLEINIYNAKRKYKQIFKKVWKNLIKNEIITKDIEMPELSANDLPLIQLR